MTNAQAHAIAEAVVDSLRATSAKTSSAALARACELAQEHCPRNPQQPVIKKEQ